MERALLVKSNRVVLGLGNWGLWKSLWKSSCCNLGTAVLSLPITTRGRRGVRFNFFKIKAKCPEF